MNSTFLAAVAAWVWVWFRPLPGSEWSGWRVIALFLILGTGGNFALGTYRAYVAPRDVLQDIVSAQEFLEGRSLYPNDMNLRMRAMLDHEGGRPLPFGLSEPASARRAREMTFQQHWVQAHPPTMTLLFAGPVAVGGVLGAQLAWALLTAASFLGIIALFACNREPPGDFWFRVCLALAAFGWGSVITVFRNGQADLLLLLLLMLGWHWLKRGRPTAAGVAIGLSVSLKLMPGVLLVVLLLRHRKAFFVALAAFALANLLTLCIVGPEAFREYWATAEGVTEEYSTYSGNVSVLAFFSRLAAYYELPFAGAKAAWMGFGGALVVGLFLLLKSRPRTADPKDAIGLEFALGIALIPLCSPVAWDHYLSFLLFPLAIGNSRNAGRWHRGLFWTVILILAVPESGYQHLYEGVAALGGPGWNYWLLEPLRTAATLGLALRAAWWIRPDRTG